MVVATRISYLHDQGFHTSLLAPGLFPELAICLQVATCVACLFTLSLTAAETCTLGNLDSSKRLTQPQKIDLTDQILLIEDRNVTRMLDPAQRWTHRKSCHIHNQRSEHRRSLGSWALIFCPPHRVQSDTNYFQNRLPPPRCSSTPLSMKSFVVLQT